VPIPVLRRLPIRLRLALWYVLCLLLAIAAIGGFLLTTLENDLQWEVDEALRLRAAHIERELAGAMEGQRDLPGAAGQLLEPAPWEELAAPGIYVQILSEEAAVLASSANLAGGQLPATAEMVVGALAGRESYASVPVGQERVRLLARPVVAGERVVGVALVGESLHPLRVTLRRTQQLLIVAAGIVAAAALAGGWWLTARTLGPISALTRVARRIAATGEFVQRVAPPPAQDELGELAATFNDMLARLERTFRGQREFLADASHELRGPLMVIRGNLDLLKLDLPEAERQACAREATEEVERMARLVADLLFLAEVDAQAMVEHRPVAVDAVVREVWQRAKARDAGSHEVVLAENDPATVRGDRDRLGQMLWNLVENALRYTPAGGKVAIALRNHGQIAELTVADTGIGIAPEHRPRIFERFYRGDPARPRGEGSTGLGLAIVKQVAEAHGGQVRVRSEPGEGSVFTVALPAEQAPGG